MTVYELIISNEGWHNKPYRCPGKKLTVGVGHNIDDNPLPPDIAAHLKKHGSITDEMIDKLLAADVRIAAADCRAIFPDFDKFTNARRMALVDFLFQLGLTRASRFVKSIALINAGQWADAAREMMRSDWARQTPNRAETITSMIEVG